MITFLKDRFKITFNELFTSELLADPARKRRIINTLFREFVGFPLDNDPIGKDPKDWVAKLREYYINNSGQVDTFYRLLGEIEHRELNVLEENN